MDIEQTRQTDWAPYRATVAEDFHYNYFNFPEFPEYLSQECHDKMMVSASAISEGLASIVRLIMDDKLDFGDTPLEDILDVPPHVLYWIRELYEPQRKVFWGRPDFYLKDGKPWLLETNLASAAGYQPQVSALCDYYESHPALRAEFDANHMRLVDPLTNLSKGIGQRVHSGELVLFADIHEGWRHKPGVSKPYSGMIAWMANNTDLRVRSSFMHDLEFRNDGVYTQGERVDHVFMSYYNPHVFERFAEFLPLWDRAAKGHLSLLDDAAEILLSNKILLAFLSEHADNLPLNDDVIFQIHKTLPWTRVIHHGDTNFENNTQDLVDLLKQNKDRFVIKRAQSAEGKQVFIGKQVPDENWIAQVEITANEGGWIAQEYINPDLVDIVFPSKEGYSTRQAEASYSPYLVNGSFAGYLNRYYDPNPEVADTNSSKNVRLEWLGTSAILATQ